MPRCAYHRYEAGGVKPDWITNIMLADCRNFYSIDTHVLTATVDKVVDANDKVVRDGADVSPICPLLEVFIKVDTAAQKSTS